MRQPSIVARGSSQRCSHGIAGKATTQRTLCSTTSTSLLWKRMRQTRVTQAAARARHRRYRTHSLCLSFAESGSAHWSPPRSRGDPGDGRGRTREESTRSRPGCGVVSMKVGARYRRLFRSSDARVVYLALTREFPDIIFVSLYVIRLRGLTDHHDHRIAPRAPERTRYRRDEYL